VLPGLRDCFSLGRPPGRRCAWANILRTDVGILGVDVGRGGVAWSKIRKRSTGTAKSYEREAGPTHANVIANAKLVVTFSAAIAATFCRDLHCRVRTKNWLDETGFVP